MQWKTVTSGWLSNRSIITIFEMHWVLEQVQNSGAGLVRVTLSLIAFTLIWDTNSRFIVSSIVKCRYNKYARRCDVVRLWHLKCAWPPLWSENGTKLSRQKRTHGIQNLYLFRQSIRRRNSIYMSTLTKGIVQPRRRARWCCIIR